MKIYFADGRTKQMPFAQITVHGFVCQSIEIEHDDFTKMLNMLERRPSDFRACMIQLQGRLARARLKQDDVIT